MNGSHWSLPAAFGIGNSPELVAFVGGGGKTSLMFALAAALPGRVVITTTTRIFAAQMRLAPALLYADDLSGLGELLNVYGQCLVVGRVEGDKALGVAPDLPARLLARPDVDYVLVEADGSRMRPVKAPADHEPVIPKGATLVVPVAGLDALERPLAEVAHRPEQVRRITNDERRMTNEATGGEEEPGMTLTTAGLARLLTHAAGGLKGVPDQARVVVFLNKVEREERLNAARQAARLMLGEVRVGHVILGAARTEQPVRELRRRVAAVVPAAGLSRRMGANKLLLSWGKTTVLGQTLANVHASSIHAITVVTGHERAGVEAIAEANGLPTVYNPDYAQGMLTSVQSAVRALPANIAAVLVVLGDQPLVRPELIDRLLNAYAATPVGLVAPVFRGQRGNPVLIDRRYFDELLALPADAAPRVLLRRHADDLLMVEVDDPAILHDLDDPEAYEQLRP